MKESGIMGALEGLHKDAKLKNHATFHQYTYYLDKHGAMGSFIIEIFGSDNFEKIDAEDYFIHKQKQFEVVYRTRLSGDENMDFFWQIATSDTGEVYFIDASEEGSGCIFVQERNGDIKFYAKDFIKIFRTNT